MGIYKITTYVKIALIGFEFWEKALAAGIKEVHKVLADFTPDI
jgi:hypothetical protein